MAWGGHLPVLRGTLWGGSTTRREPHLDSFPQTSLWVREQQEMMPFFI